MIGELLDLAQLGNEESGAEKLLENNNKQKSIIDKGQAEDESGSGGELINIILIAFGVENEKGLGQIHQQKYGDEGTVSLPLAVSVQDLEQQIQVDDAHQPQLVQKEEKQNRDGQHAEVAHEDVPQQSLSLIILVVVLLREAGSPDQNQQFELLDHQNHVHHHRRQNVNRQIQSVINQLKQNESVPARLGNQV